MILSFRPSMHFMVELAYLQPKDLGLLEIIRPVSLIGDVLDKSCHVLVQDRKLYLFGAGTAS